MKKVSLKPLNRTTQIDTNARILDALLAEKVDVLMACGGRGRCATCHVYVEEGADCLSPMEMREKRTLGRLSARGENSRLACQARVLKEGVKVRLPKGMYVTERINLQSLVGKRAQENILHPIDGSILIEEGKLITRYAVMELEAIDFNNDIEAQSAQWRD